MEELGFIGLHILGGEVANLDSCLLCTIACVIVWISNYLIEHVSDHLPFAILILKCSILVRLCDAYARCGPYWDDSSFIITIRNRESMNGSFHIHKIPLYLLVKGNKK